MTAVFDPDARPRCWIAGYDRWHLAAPALLAVIAALIAWLPAPPPPPAPPPLARPVVLSPAPGVHVPAGGTAPLGGLAQPGGVAGLFWGQRCLARQEIGPEGRFLFQPTGFPVGTNTLWVQIVSGSQSAWSAPIPWIVDPPPKPPRTRRQPKR